MRVATVLVCFLLVASTTTAAVAADLLTVADVERVSGLTGLHTIPKNQATGAGGDLNFAGADNKLVAIVMISTSMFDFWKKQYSPSCDPVPGIGTDAFRTKPRAAIAYIVFQKGGTGVWIQSIGFKAGGPTLTSDQLTALAKIAASRL